MSEHNKGFEYLNEQWLAGALRKIQRDSPWASADCEASIDVRLQVAEGDAAVHHGDPGFDVDHHGYWGSSHITSDDDWSRLLEIARDMIKQAKSQLYESRIPD